MRIPRRELPFSKHPLRVSVGLLLCAKDLLRTIGGKDRLTNLSLRVTGASLRATGSILRAINLPLRLRRTPSDQMPWEETWRKWFCWRRFTSEPDFSSPESLVGDDCARFTARWVASTPARWHGIDREPIPLPPPVLFN